MLTRIRTARGEREGGFTLVELLVVVIIIGILAAVAIPVFLNQREKGYDAQAKHDLRNLATLQETYLTDQQHYGTLAQLTAAPYNYQTSPNSGAMATVVKWRDSSDALTTTQSAATGGYVLCTTADSGKTWVYDSVNGGLLATHTCPTT